MNERTVQNLTDLSAMSRRASLLVVDNKQLTLNKLIRSSGWAALFGGAALGMGLGSEADVGPYLLARYFGRRHFSVLSGLTWTAYAIGGATGPLWIGHLYDRAGAYLPRFIVYLAAVAFGAVILSFFLQSARESIETEHEVVIQTNLPLEG